MVITSWHNYITSRVQSHAHAHRSASARAEFVYIDMSRCHIMSHHDIVCKQSRVCAPWLSKASQWNIWLCDTARNWIWTNSDTPF